MWNVFASNVVLYNTLDALDSRQKFEFKMADHCQNEYSLLVSKWYVSILLQSTKEPGNYLITNLLNKSIHTRNPMIAFCPTIRNNHFAPRNYLHVLALPIKMYYSVLENSTFCKIMFKNPLLHYTIRCLGLQGWKNTLPLLILHTICKCIDILFQD